MPKYQYQCLKCKNSKSFNMKVSDFLVFKKKESNCEECKKGKMIQVVHSSHGKIQRDKQYSTQNAKEYARKTVQKIRNGDESTFIDIYGDSPNKLKNKQ